jgi:pyruvate formate lyase activating enzyme
MQRLGLFEINILPFHRLGDTKWTQLGKEYQFRDKISTPEEKLFHIQDIFLSKHIACYVGSDTPFKGRRRANTWTSKHDPLLHLLQLPNWR